MPSDCLRAPALGRPRALPPLKGFLTALVALSCVAALAAASTPRVHAIVGARIVMAPGQVIEHGTIVMRDGLITAVGANVPVPADARVWEGDSLTIYPGLIDAFVLPAEAPAASPAGRPGPPGQRPLPTPPPPQKGAVHELASVHPEARMVSSLPLDRDQVESLRGAGFAAAQVAPRSGIFRGQSAVFGLGDGSPNGLLVERDAAAVVALDPQGNTYPGSLMGAIAVIRQAFLDTKWYRDARAAYAKSPSRSERIQENLAWEALQPVIAGRQPVLFVAGDMLQVLRSAALGREAGVAGAIVGGGDEYKRVQEIAATGASLIVPVNFPEAPDVSNPDDALEVSTEELRHWNDAPANPGVLARHGIGFALTSNGLKDVKQFRANIGKAIERGLTGDAALAAVTTVPAKLLGLSERIGTLAAGKIANLTVTRGELFSEQGKVREVWVDGNRYEVSNDETSLAGTWSIGWGGSKHTLMVSAEKDTTVRIVVVADTLSARAIRLDGQHLRFTVQRGSEAAEDFDLTAKNDALSGTLSVTGVGSHVVTGSKLPDDAVKNPGKNGHAGAKPKDEPIATPVVMGNSEAWRARAPEQPAAVLVKHATLWTAGAKGTLEGADLLIEKGKIAAVGKDLKAPAGAMVIDATGKHVAPGIIDEHSHSAILGNVNECTNSVTAEVRIQDVINSESINIYRQLAGGGTVMHLLHGSCNSIGGQCAVIRNKWGEPPDQLLFAAAPWTLKFALGENPKQANFGLERTGRYPQTRGGVEQIIRDAFARARDYRDARAEFKAGKRPIAPRPDLALDALVEVMEGKRFIHVHSYRQDEILMLMRLADSLGFRIGTFTHILEGYKVADEMATHGAMGGGFSDWWAYKYEVIDAIPYNGYLMWDRGVVVGYNSDSDELARRLNTEAAKAIKYGGVPPEEAIKFVTLNPAKQLGIDSRVGSPEVGKDADFAIWNGSPLSPYSLCEQTWIEGRKYFDRAADLAGREALAKERAALIVRAKAAKKENPPGGTSHGNWPPRYLEAADQSGNDCGDNPYEMPFLSETARKALQNGEVQR